MPQSSTYRIIETLYELLCVNDSFGEGLARLGKKKKQGINFSIYLINVSLILNCMPPITVAQLHLQLKSTSTYPEGRSTIGLQ